jgi:hypothetical protein
MAKENKTTYIVLLLVVGVLLVWQIQGDKTTSAAPEDEILPEAQHCIDKGLEVSYSTISVGEDTVIPIEYCKIQDFCDNYAVSIVLEGESFDTATLSVKEDKWDEFGTCFKEEAVHTQRNFPGPNPDGKAVKSMYLCCDEDITCKANTCDGIFTGMRDDAGCKLYAKELCKASTDCTSVAGKRVCDPQPFVNGCEWETKTDFGKTFFTEFHNCGLELEQPCDTKSKYRCTSDTDVLCDMEYDYPTGTYIEACGGWTD